MHTQWRDVRTSGSDSLAASKAAFLRLERSSNYLGRLVHILRYESNNLETNDGNRGTEGRFVRDGTTA